MAQGAKWLVVFLAGLMAACAQPPVPEDQFYRVQVSPPGPAEANRALGGVIEVERLAADGLTAGRPIVYADAAVPHKLLEYHYHFWVEPPTVMLRDQLVAYLRGAGIGKTVVTPEMRAAPDFVIAGKIHRLERLLGIGPRAIVELELGVRRNTDGRLLLVKSYREEMPVAGDQVGDAVTALNEGLARIYRAFVADLGKL